MKALVELSFMTLYPMNLHFCNISSLHLWIYIYENTVIKHFELMRMWRSTKVLLLMVQVNATSFTALYQARISKAMHSRGNIQFFIDWGHLIASIRCAMHIFLRTVFYSWLQGALIQIDSDDDVTLGHISTKTSKCFNPNMMMLHSNQFESDQIKCSTCFNWN